MISGSITISPPEILNRLTASLEQYQRVSGKTSQQVLIKQGQKLAVELYKSFRSVTPPKGFILAKIKAGGWALGRDGGDAEAGISNTAWARARAKMGGFKSILAQVSEEADKIILQGVRVGKRGRRVLGGRRGLGGSAVSGTDQSGIGRGDSVVLNFRAVQTIEEINLREHGRRFLAIAWNYRRWLQAGKGPLKATTLVNVNPRSHIGYGMLGSVQLAGNPDNGGAVSLTLTSNVPGTREVGEAHGLFAHAVAMLTEDIRTYLLDEQRKALFAALKEGIAA